MAYETRNGSLIRTGRKAVARARADYFATRLNRYTCQKCGGNIITVDREEGVTPFMLGCYATKDCDGDMYSSFYRDAEGVPTYEWRKPPLEEYAAMSPAMRGHADQGGLNLYPIDAAKVNDEERMALERKAIERMKAKIDRDIERAIFGGSIQNNVAGNNGSSLDRRNIR